MAFMVANINMRARRNGFTLIELSMVMVVIGLLAAGILVGRQMLKAAELRSVATDSIRFKTEFGAFKLKYNGIPGDLRNATSFFGGSVTNGNGNRRIDYLLGEPGEEYLAWNHLSAADMVDGSYDGTPSSLPKSKVSGGLYRISYQTSVYGKNGHMISLNAMNTVLSRAHNALLSPIDAYSVDAKIDDGLADKGRVFGFNPEGVPGCVTNYHTSPTGDYMLTDSLTNNTVLCKLYMRVDL